MSWTKLKANKERSTFNTLPEEASRELFLLPEIFNPYYLATWRKKKCLNRENCILTRLVPFWQGRFSIFFRVRVCNWNNRVKSWQTDEVFFYILRASLILMLDCNHSAPQRGKQTKAFGIKTVWARQGLKYISLY